MGSTHSDRAIARADGESNALDAGVGSAYVEFWSAGSGIPANATVALTDQTLIVTIGLNKPSYAAAAVVGSSGEAALIVSPVISGNSVSVGVIAFARVFGADGSLFRQGSVSVTGGGGDFKLDTPTSAVVGQTFTITAGTWIEPTE